MGDRFQNENLYWNSREMEGVHRFDLVRTELSHGISDLFSNATKLKDYHQEWSRTEPRHYVWEQTETARRGIRSLRSDTWQVTVKHQGKTFNLYSKNLSKEFVFVFVFYGFAIGKDGKSGNPINPGIKTVVQRTRIGYPIKYRSTTLLSGLMSRLPRKEALDQEYCAGTLSTELRMPAPPADVTDDEVYQRFKQCMNQKKKNEADSFDLIKKYYSGNQT